MSFKKTNRQIHKWGSIIIALPLLVVCITGILLLLKKQLSFVQPPTAKSATAEPSLAFDQLLNVAKSVDSAQIKTWKDIDRLDVRPNKGIIKIRSENDVEIQIDSGTGEILHVAVRRSDFIESIHDGTFFEKNANLWLMLPVTIVFIFILITGVILFVTPLLNKNKRRSTD